ncbi:MAG TPA: YtxH domain-containing protein [Candidatus Kapabacteria bacterium]|nr:YtxH domain-containing protein [Candidatus Kapabacteria bacterium]
MFNRKPSSKTPVFAGTVAGAAVGAVTALLLAPKKGKDLRKDIKRSMDAIPDEVNSMLGKEKKRVRRVVARKRSRSAS